MVHLATRFIGLVLAASHAVSSLAPPDPHSQSLIDGTVTQLEDILKSPRSPCDKCIAAMALGHNVSTTAPHAVPEVLIEYCKRHGQASSKHKKLCQHRFGRSTTVDKDGGLALGDDIANVLALMDPTSLDAVYACHYLVDNACPLPAVPNFDLSGWWPPKPENAREPDPSGETFNVLHVSDFHVDLDYLVGSESNCSQSMCCTEHSYHDAVPDEVIQAPAHAYGGYYCDVPKDLLKSSMDSVAEIHKSKNFQFAIFTGDMADHEQEQYQSLDDAIESEKVSYRFMKNAIKDIPFYITLGNHDSYPYGQIAQAKSGHENRFAWNTDLAYDMWTGMDWLTEPEAAAARDHYAAFSVATKHQGLRVISLNANFWYLSNYYNYWATETDSDSSGMLRFLSDELLACEKNGERAWVIAHVPTGGTLEEALPGPSQVFYQVLERFSPHVVAGVFFGHTHRDEFQVMYAQNATQKTEANALTVAFLDESVTPFRDHNPGWRYYEVDSATYSVVNIHHYYTKLNETFGLPGENGTAADDRLPVWEYGYSARDAYDPDHSWPATAPLNATFWHRVVHDKILTSQTYRDLYEQYAHRRAPGGGMGCRSERCLHELYCYMTTFTVPQAAACLASKPSSVLAAAGSWSESDWRTCGLAVLTGAVASVAAVGVYYLGRRLVLSWSKGGYEPLQK